MAKKPTPVRRKQAGKQTKGQIFGRATIQFRPKSAAKTGSGRVTAAPLAAAPPQAGIFVWADDPRSANASPIVRPIPNPNAWALKVTTQGGGINPGIYQPGTPEFRYWTAQEALYRCIAFWSPLLPPGARWFTGATLPVVLNAGTQLNAYYDRMNLNFFQDTVGGKVVYSGESPDIVCHEMGHAILDILKPELFNTNLVEVAAFHESFADISALLSALQLPSFCAAVLAETGGNLGNSSRLSRIGEELGWAINQRRPDLASPDYLRNAVNAYFYMSPVSLATSGPDSSLNAEPHNFSRVFTGGFFDALVEMITQTKNPPDVAAVQSAALDAARLLVVGVQAAAVTGDFYFQVASAMIAADATPGPNSGKYDTALRGAFVRRGILPVASLTVVGTRPAATPVAARAAFASAASVAVAAAPAAAPTSSLQELPAQQFGFFRGTLTVEAATSCAQVAATPTFAAVSRGDSDEQMTRFITYLFQRGRVELDEPSKTKSRLGFSQARKTHTVTMENGRMVLRRKCFDCGFD